MQGPSRDVEERKCRNAERWDGMIGGLGSFRAPDGQPAIVTQRHREGHPMDSSLANVQLVRDQYD
jgi:hypothetical protein